MDIHRFVVEFCKPQLTRSAVAQPSRGLRVRSASGRQDKHVGATPRELQARRLRYRICPTISAVVAVGSDTMTGPVITPLADWRS